VTGPPRLVSRHCTTGAGFLKMLFSSLGPMAEARSPGPPARVAGWGRDTEPAGVPGRGGGQVASAAPPTLARRAKSTVVTTSTRSPCVATFRVTR